MKLKVDKSLLPVKMHFFFFFAALGPLLPQMNVFGRQMGVSPGVMGLVTAVLPLLWAAAKPVFGYVVDYWPAHRKLIFMLLITVMTGSYCGLWFLPMPNEPITQPVLEYIYQLNDTVFLRQVDNSTIDNMLQKYNCHWNCSEANSFEVYFSNSTHISTVYIKDDVSNTSCSFLHMELDDAREGEVVCAAKHNCSLMCYDEELSETTNNRTKREVDNVSYKNNVIGNEKENGEMKNVLKKESTVEGTSINFYMTAAFWLFVILMCVGTVAFNVANCIGDAVCFDVLGPDHVSKYGAQRAWGTAGYGITALLGGWLVDIASGNRQVKDFSPAFIVAIVATVIDLFSCRALTLPSLSSPEDSGKALRDVLRVPRVIVFITFAVIVGIFDSFIIYYMFWFLEELAESTGHMGQIKLIEGVVVAGQSFVGELLFFFFSGRILKRLGYGTTLTICLFCYGLRMVLISFIQHPWHMVIVESVMQGPTYALCYSTIVGYAAQVAPEGYSATVQGIVAGMDDGVGFALGSLVGGQLYSWVGGRASFRALAATAVLAGTAHAVLFARVTRADKRTPEKQTSEVLAQEDERMLPKQEYGNSVYRDTVVPLNRDGDKV